MLQLLERVGWKTQETDSIKSRSHPRHLVGKGTAQKDAIKDTSDSQGSRLGTASNKITEGLQLVWGRPTLALSSALVSQTLSCIVCPNTWFSYLLISHCWGLKFCIFYLTQDWSMWHSKITDRNVWPAALYVHASFACFSHAAKWTAQNCCKSAFQILFVLNKLKYFHFICRAKRLSTASRIHAREGKRKYTVLAHRSQGSWGAYCIDRLHQPSYILCGSTNLIYFSSETTWLTVTKFICYLQGL